MNIKAPNPAALGLAGFALTTWLLNMINAGWFSANSMGMVLPVGTIIQEVDVTVTVAEGLRGAWKQAAAIARCRAYG